MGKSSLSKMVCIVFVFCAATAIASPAQTLTTLHSFAGSPNDGNTPNAGLVQGSDGNFYGTTVKGGASASICQDGCGTVFKVTRAGTLTVLHSFCVTYPCADGIAPYAALVQGTDGNFYGTAYSGGKFNSGGTVFKITPAGALTALYNFCSQTNCADGRQPYAGLVQGSGRELLRDNLRGRGLRPRHGLQNHARGRADHAVQLLRSDELH